MIARERSRLVGTHRHRPWRTGLLTLTGDVVNDAYRKLGVQGDGEAAGSFAGTGVWPAATNLCTNGGFETNTAGWASEETIARSTAQAKFGTASLLCTDAGAAGNAYAYYNAILTAVAHTASLWGYIPTNYDGDGLGLSFESYVGASPSAAVVTPFDMNLRDQWQRASATLTPVAGDLDGYIAVRGTGAAPTLGRFFYIDGVQLQTGSVATPYIETDGGTATSTAGRVQMPVPRGFNPTAGAWLERWYPGHANTQITAGYATLRRWADDADNLLELRYDYANARYSFRRRAAAAETEVTVAATFALAAKQTLLATWSPTTIALSINGAAATSGANTNIPTLAATTIDVGSLSGTSQHSQGRHVFSVGFGPGGQLLGNADSARVNRLGARIDPLTDLPRPEDLLAFWDGVNNTYQVFA